jgi:serpin B
MDRVLHFTLPQDRLHPAAGALIRDLCGAVETKRSYDLRVGNALWAQEGYAFLNDYFTQTRKHYGARLSHLDFITARETARKTINRDVASATEDKIRDLLKEEHLTAATRLVLTNIVYFKGQWETKFEPKATREHPFHVTADRAVKVDLMVRTAPFAYLDGDTFQLVELPYTGKDLSLLVLLPRAADGLPTLEQALTPEKLTEWCGKMRSTSITMFLPKFKVTGAFELKEVLSSMGMSTAFDSKKADFSGMDGTRTLFIQNVIHKVYVDVNEDGTEAAGATAVVIGRHAAPPKGAVVRADHPFVFLLRDNRSGSILIVGRVVDPMK